VPLLVVAGLQWNAWHDRVVGDNTPNPYYWGGVGLFLFVAGIAAYEVARRGYSLEMPKVGIEPTRPSRGTGF
jgi:hypothetical protein